MKKATARLLIAAIALLPIAGVACTEHDADVASENLSTEADQFHILRRIVFYNGITEQYMLEIEGFCSLGNQDAARELSVTCKTAGVGTDTKDDDRYIKDFLGLSDNVTYFVEQLDGANVSVDHYKVIWKPSTIVPDFDAS